MKIRMLFSFKNYVCIKDLVTGNIWLYSFNDPIAYYDGKLHVVKTELTQTNKFHIANFKKFLLT